MITLPRINPANTAFGALLPKPAPIPRAPAVVPNMAVPMGAPAGSGGSPYGGTSGNNPADTAFNAMLPKPPAIPRLATPTTQTQPTQIVPPGTPPPTPPPLPHGGTLNPNDPAAISGAIMDKNKIPATTDNATSTISTTTTDGKKINPSTGGVSEKTAAEIAADEAAKAYSGTITPSSAETATQAESDALAANYGLDKNANRQRAIPMPFITGAEAALERSYNLNAGTLEQRMARQQASRIASQNVSKFALERADKAVTNEQAIAKETRAAATKKAEGVNLSPGEAHYSYDENGNLIQDVKNPANPTAADKPMVQKVGNDLFERQPDGTWKKVTTGGTGGYSHVTDVLDAINTLKDMPGESHAIGTNWMLGLGKRIPGTNSSTYLAQVDRIKNILSLDNIKYLKGTGAISDAEERMLASAATTLNSSMSETEFNAEIDRLKTKLTAELAKEQNKTGVDTNIDINDPDFQSLRNKPSLKDKTDQEIWDALGKHKVGSDTENAQVDDKKLSVTFPDGTMKYGGTAAWRNNNPGNIKISEFSRKYGASKGSKALDGGNFAAFPTLEAGMKAQRALLRAPSYSDLPLDAALHRWSNGGYGAEIVPSLKGKKTGDMSDQELNMLIRAQNKHEGWKEGTTVPSYFA